MSVFFDHQIHSNFAGEKYTDFAWHKSYGLLAVAGGSQTGGQTVAIFQQEGECLPGSIQRQTQPATVLAWHPVKKILAVGWETGKITVRNEHDNEIYEAQHLHKSPIIVMHWSSNGSQLISGEADGNLIVWKVDGKGRPYQNVVFKESIREQPTFLVLLNPQAVDPAFDIKSLARAAVRGDETALDMFSWKRGGSKVPLTSLGPQEAVAYFVGGAQGRVFYLDEKPSLETRLEVEGSVKKLLIHEERNLLVVLSSSMMIALCSVSPERDTKLIMSVKINGRPSTTDIVWAGRGLLATCTGERYIRMWDVDKDENYVLQLDQADSYGIISSISFSGKGILACGAESGKVIQWKYSPLLGDKRLIAEPEDDWQLQNVSSISGTILDIGFGSGKNLLAVNTSDALYILHEQDPAAHCYKELAVVQTGSMQLTIDNYDRNETFSLNADIQIKELCCNKDALAIANGKKVVVYDITGGTSSSHVIGSFNSDTHLICMYEQNLYTLEPGKVQVRNFQGTVKQLLAFPNADDEISSMHISGSFLVISTNTSCVKTFDLSRREAKNHCGPKQFSGIIADLWKIISAKCNCSGTKVSLMVAKSEGSTDSRLYIWDTETNSVQYFNFSSGRDDVDESSSSSSSSSSSTDRSKSKTGRDQTSREVRGRVPTSHHWDSEDPKLLVCEARFVPEKKSPGDKDPTGGCPPKNDEVEVMVVSLFCTQDHGILIHDNFPLPDDCSRVVSLEMPYYYFTRRKNAVAHLSAGGDEVSSNHLQHRQMKQQHQRQLVQTRTIGRDSASCRRIHRNFVGLEGADRQGREAMMNFSFHLTVGDMDEAFKAIKLIKSESVWENMAKMCVKTRRLDVARVCLGNMRDARGARLLREVVEREPEVDAQVACLAIILGLYEDAERLLKNCKRYDLLNDFYQNSGDWDKALGISELHDRINLRRTNYNYAKFLEAGSNFREATKHYERSGTHVFEVPRMLLHDVTALEDYVNTSNDEALYKWWAQYQEGIGEMDEAIKYYEKAHDSFSMTRLYCALDQLDKAAQICESSGDRAACFHVGRKCESAGKIQEAIGYFNKARALGNAIRLCKDGKFDDRLLNMAIKGSSDDMLEAARYCEQRPGFEEKAALLYHKAGYSSKAIELAFEKRQFAALQIISESFDEGTDPLLLQRCAEFFVSNSHFDRAVSLLASAKKHLEALRICKEQHVPMTEDLVERLSPMEKELNFSNEEKNRILEAIGDVCMDQRLYHLATKKYTQSGNRIKAMKALLKSGDTEKIVLFANVSRQREIYIMAGHYLQTLDWQKDPETMKNIIKFYTKGQALGHLAGFYESCAELEIDRYQDYEKALGALGEACKHLMRGAKNNPDDDQLQTRLNDLKERMTLIHKFIEAKNLNSTESIKICQSLLSEPNFEQAVRTGDVFGFMTRFFAGSGKWKMAHGCIEELQKRMPEVDLVQYIGRDVLKSVFSALNLELVDHRQKNQRDNKNPLKGQDEEVEEEEEVYEEEIPVED